ncbi:type VII secretion protein EccB [Actinoplanes sp. TBRC 11911]|nr:type VII secretion protein EccB [Actinoplanes sp. TBRC 11911]
MGRLTGALVGADPDGLENPHRRMVTGTISGVLIAALIVSGFAVFGFVVPGGSAKWKKPGALVLEKETGSRYIYMGGRLRPVLNYTSAWMYFGKKPQVVGVSSKSLHGVAHGQPMGITGAPDALPTDASVTDQAWTVCAPAGSEGMTLTVDRPGTGPSRDVALEPDSAVVVSSGGQSFLLWRSRRLRLTQPWLPRVLGYDGTPVAMPAAALDSVPFGPEIAPPSITGRGEAGPKIDGHPSKIGQLFVVRTTGTPDRYYWLRRDGLVELGPTAYSMIAADPLSTHAYDGPVRAIELSPAGLAQLPVSHGAVLPDGVPDTPPRAAQLPPGDAWCTRQTMADGRIEIVFGKPVPSGDVGRDTSGGITRTPDTAAAVAVQPGVGGLVTTRAGLYLLTDAGIKFPIGSKIAGVLGYPPDKAKPIPDRLLAMLPTGPPLGTGAVEGVVQATTTSVD